jgi:hypothetical protein
MPYIAWSFLLCSLLLFLTYAGSVIQQIADAIGISVLWVPKEL